MVFKSLHHSFDIDLAAEYGVEEAILIHHFQHWISLNRKRKKNFHEGRTWSYQTIQEIADHFPYWTLDEVRNLIERLCGGHCRFSKSKKKDFHPVLKKGNFNKRKMDKTSWYAFTDEEKFLNSKNVYERLHNQMHKGGQPKQYQILNTDKVPPLTPPHPKKRETYSEEEELFFKEKMKKWDHEGNPVKSEEGLKKHLIGKFRKVKAGKNAVIENEKLIEKNISIGKEIYKHMIKDPSKWRVIPHFDELTGIFLMGSLYIMPNQSTLSYEEEIHKWRKP